MLTVWQCQLDFWCTQVINAKSRGSDKRELSSNQAQFLSIKKLDCCHKRFYRRCISDYPLKVCIPSDVIACDVISQAFLRHSGILQAIKIWSWRRPGTRLCILFAVYTSNSACCQDYAICHFLRLLRSFQFLVTLACSWSIWTLYRLRQPSSSRLGPTKTQCWLKCKDLCSMVDLLKSQREECKRNWRRKELSVLDGCVLWGARGVVQIPQREWVIQELGERHPGIARIKRLARSCVWWPSMDANLEAKVRTSTKCQSSQPPEWLYWYKWGGDVIYLTFHWLNLSNLYINFCMS